VNLETETWPVYFPFANQKSPTNIEEFCWLNVADAVRTWFIKNGWIFIAHPKSEVICTILNPLNPIRRRLIKFGLF
jgi:hypothetical protein